METEGLLAVGANAGNSAGALAAPFARQSRSPTKPGALGATHRSAWGNGWELGFARRREAEGLLAVGANAGNSAGAPAAPFARQSRSPTSPGALGAAHRRAWGSGWELGFARRREAEGLLAVGANAGNSAGRLRRHSPGRAGLQQARGAWGAIRPAEPISNKPGAPFTNPGASSTHKSPLLDQSGNRHAHTGHHRREASGPRARLSGGGEREPSARRAAQLRDPLQGHPGLRALRGADARQAPPADLRRTGR